MSSGPKRYEYHTPYLGNPAIFSSVEDSWPLDGSEYVRAEDYDALAARLADLEPACRALKESSPEARMAAIDALTEELNAATTEEERSNLRELLTGAHSCRARSRKIARWVSRFGPA